MKIIYVHTDPFPSPMAGSVFSLSTAIGLAQAGHETMLLMPDAEKSVAEGLAYYNLDVPPNLRIVLPASQKIRIGPIRVNHTRRYYLAVARFLRSEGADADAIIVRTVRLAAFLAEAGLPAPIVYEMHNWYADLNRKWEGATWMISKKKLRREARLQVDEANAIPKMAGIITMREATATVARESFPGVSVRAIPPGVTAPPALPKVSPEPVVIYVGQLHLHKGLDVLFDAAKLATGLRFLIVGAGEHLDHWKWVAREAKIADRVSFTGHIPKAQLAQQLAAGRVGVLPLLDCFFNRYLTSPLKIMEYFEAGLPVVASQTPVTEELVVHEINGLLVPFGDAGALAAALERLCLDEALHTHCRQTIFNSLHRLTWARRGRHIGEFIEQRIKR